MKLLLALVLGYGAIVGLLYTAQTSMIFPGAKLPGLRLDGPVPPERIDLSSPDGARLHGVLLRAREGEGEGGDLLLGFGGNAQDAEMLAQDLAGRLPGLDVVVFHYRGYGPSTGSPSEEALLADALLIHDELEARLQPRRTFAIGVSLGSAVATWLAKERQLDGAILITPFDSIEAIAKETYFWVPVGWLLKHRFPSAEFVAGTRVPVAVIAAENDSIIKPHRTRAFIERVPNLVFERTIAGADHNTIIQFPAYDTALREAFAALGRAGERERAD